MNNDLFRNSNEPAAWRMAAADMNSDLRTVDMEAARRTASPLITEKDAEAQRTQAAEPARKLVQQMQSSQWPANRTHFTLGQLDTDMLILMAERRVLDWQSVFNAKAAFGTADDLISIQRQALLTGNTPNVNTALSHAAKPVLLVAGLRHEGNISTTEQLFKMGADPNTDNNGTLFMNVVDAGRADIGRVFAKYGQNGLLNVDNWVNYAKSNRKLKLFDDLRKIAWEYGRYNVIDNETLQESKPLPDNAGNLKVVFNFGSRRVNEILELANPKQTVLKDYSFDDYGQPALEAARDKLIEMGARPSGVDLPMRGKAVVARPSALGLPGKTG